MIKAAVFDLDHTLFDRYKTFRAIIDMSDNRELPFKEDMDRQKMAEVLEKYDRKFVHFGWPRVTQELKKSGYLKDEIGEEDIFPSYIRPLFYKAAVPYSFTKPVLSKLRDSGIKTGLITNGIRDLQYKKLQMLDITDCFDQIIVSGDTPYRKPDPRVFEIMTARMGLPPEEMLYIGDNPLNDIKCSREAGYIPVWVKTINEWVYPDIEKPQYIIDNVSEIPDLITKINLKKTAI